MESLHQLETIILLLIAVLALAAIRAQTCDPLPHLAGDRRVGLRTSFPACRRCDSILTSFSSSFFLLFFGLLPTSRRGAISVRTLRPITLLAVGLVLATTAAVAVVAHIWLPGLGWAGAIALGAIVSPPDAVSATAVAKRLGLPHRVVTILEGESLVNDATTLILYRAAVMAAISGTFTFSDTVLDFFMATGVGVVVGLLVGVVARWALKLMKDSFSEIAVTLLSPYIAWVLAEQAHASGVLACVAGGLYLRNISVRPSRLRQGFKRGPCGTSLCSC